jgi:hypothetical protein
MHLKKDGVQQQLGLHVDIAAQPLRPVVQQYHVQALFLKKMTTEAKSYVSTPTHGDHAFGRDLTKGRRFSSSGLSLVFEGLLLGLSLCLHAKATSSSPCAYWDIKFIMPPHTGKCFVGS